MTKRNLLAAGLAALGAALAITLVLSSSASEAQPGQDSRCDGLTGQAKGRCVSAVAAGCFPGDESVSEALCDKFSEKWDDCVAADKCPPAPPPWNEGEDGVCPCGSTAALVQSLSILGDAVLFCGNHPGGSTICDNDDAYPGCEDFYFYVVNSVPDGSGGVCGRYNMPNLSDVVYEGLSYVDPYEVRACNTVVFEACATIGPPPECTEDADCIPMDCTRCELGKCWDCI